MDLPTCAPSLYVELAHSKVKKNMMLQTVIIYTSKDSLLLLHVYYFALLPKVPPKNPTLGLHEEILSGPEKENLLKQSHMLSERNLF